MNCKDDQTAMTVKLQTIYPGVFIDVNHMFGCYDDSNNWRDGLFTSFMRKSTKVIKILTRNILYMYMYCTLAYNRPL